MDNEEQISKALQMKGRMRAIILQGYILMADMALPPSAEYAATMAMVWEPEALAEMPVSLGIISQALKDIQEQCPNLSAKIFPQTMIETMIETLQEVQDAS